MKRTNEIERRPHEHTVDSSLTLQLLKPPKANKTQIKSIDFDRLLREPPRSQKNMIGNDETH